MPHDLPPVLTVAEVADALRVPKPTVYRWARTGVLPAVKVGHAVRFRREDIEKLLETERTA